MNEEYIRHTLQTIPLNFDSHTIDAVVQFLTEQIGVLSEQDKLYQICSAAAIVSESLTIPTVNNQLTVTNGIHIENIMRHLPGLSKERFLQILTTQVRKWNEAPSFLLGKIQSISISYRLFKKYKEAFLKLCSNMIDESVASELLAFFWIIYLLVKLKSSDPLNLIDNTTILCTILTYVFAHVFKHPPQHVCNHLKLTFQEIDPISIDSSNYIHSLEQEIKQIFQIRFPTQLPTIQTLISNPIMLQRLVDDLSNKYSKIMEELPKYIIDQITYLELNKNLTPYQISSKVYSNIQPISTTLDFYDNDDEDNPPFNYPQHLSNKSFTPQTPTSLPTSIKPRLNINILSPLPKRNREEEHATPITQKLQNMNWIRQCLSAVDQSKINKIRQKIQSVNSEHRQQESIERIKRIIIELTPHCMDVDKRQSQIYTFYQYILLRLSLYHSQEQIQLLFSKQSNLNSFLCLSTELFNFCYQPLTNQFRKYCQVFSIDIITAFKPINWMGKSLQLPPGLKLHLFQLQKQILIKQIWEDDTGYKLITSKDNLQFTDCALISRLHKHIHERVVELSKIVGIQPKHISKVNGLVIHIIEKKPYLLQGNRIDQIIICSLTFCLRQNLDRKSMSQIFDLYNQVQHSFYSFKDNMRGYQRSELNLLEFYNQVFLHQLQNIQFESNNFLITPVRNQLLSKAKTGLETPFPQKFKDHTSFPLFNNKKVKTNPFTYCNLLAANVIKTEKTNASQYYRHGLLENLRQAEKQQSQQSDQNAESPKFGMTRHFSFGKN